MKFKKFLNNFLLLSFTASLGGLIQPLASINQVTKKESKTNSNNHPLVKYDDADFVASQSHRFNSSFVLKDDSEMIEIKRAGTSWTFPLREGVDAHDFQQDYGWLTLYDTTDGELNFVHEWFVEKLILFWWDAIPAFISLEPNNSGLRFDTDELNLKEFHQYRLGFNLNKGDDTRAYSDAISLHEPVMDLFEITSQEDALIIKWNFQEKYEDIAYKFNEIYVKIGNKKYSLGTDLSGEYRIDNLKSASEYKIIFGYNADKIFNSGRSYQINKEENYTISTNMPQNYATATLAASFIILLILLLIILLLIIIILYWNHQRRKVTALALSGDEGEMWNDSSNNHYLDQELKNNYDINDYYAEETGLYNSQEEKFDNYSSANEDSEIENWGAQYE